VLPFVAAWHNRAFVWYVQQRGVDQTVVVWPRNSGTADLIFPVGPNRPSIMPTTATEPNGWFKS
jgi:hypothetical protein